MWTNCLLFNCIFSLYHIHIYVCIYLKGWNESLTLSSTSPKTTLHKRLSIKHNDLVLGEPGREIICLCRKIANHRLDQLWRTCDDFIWLLQWTGWANHGNDAQSSKLDQKWEKNIVQLASFYMLIVCLNFFSEFD